MSTTTTDEPQSAVRRPAWLAVVARHALVLVSGWGACALSLPETRRPAMTLAALAALAVVAALVTGWRTVGSLAVVLVSATPLLAGALEDDAAAPARLVATAVLVLVLIVGLDGVERRDRGLPAPVVVQETTRASRWGAPAVAVASCGLLGLVFAATVSPSVAFVLLGLLAAVGAVLVATRLH